MTALMIMPPLSTCPALVSASGERTQLRCLEFFASQSPQPAHPVSAILSGCCTQYRHRREDALALLRFIDWMIWLPRHLDEELRNELIEHKESINMPYVMSFERLAEARGEKRGEK